MYEHQDMIRFLFEKLWNTVQLSHLSAWESLASKENEAGLWRLNLGSKRSPWRITGISWENLETKKTHLSPKACWKRVLTRNRYNQQALKKWAYWLNLEINVNSCDRMQRQRRVNAHTSFVPDIPVCLLFEMLASLGSWNHNYHMLLCCYIRLIIVMRMLLLSLHHCRILPKYTIFGIVMRWKSGRTRTSKSSSPTLPAVNSPNTTPWPV